MGSTAAPAGAKPRPARRRLATDLAGRLRYGRPAFIVPGAQKCGTTAVAVYLARHPRIQVATTKEPDFFSRDARYHGLGTEGYRRLFPRGRRRSLKGQLFFEASVSYLTSPVAPERMAAFDPSLRFVVMVRNPAARAYSAWNWYRTLVTVPRQRDRFEAWLEDHNAQDRAAGIELLSTSGFPSFGEAIERELDSIDRHGPSPTLPALITGGLYALHLERFLAVFPREHFLVVEDRELADDAAATLNRILTFLGVPAREWDESFAKVFVGDYEQSPDGAVLERLRAFYEPHNRRLFELVGRSFDW